MDKRVTRALALATPMPFLGQEMQEEEIKYYYEKEDEEDLEDRHDENIGEELSLADYRRKLKILTEDGKNNPKSYQLSTLQDPSTMRTLTKNLKTCYG